MAMHILVGQFSSFSFLANGLNSFFIPVNRIVTKPKTAID